MAVGNGETVGVQACHYSDVSKRMTKIANADAIGAVRTAGCASSINVSMAWLVKGMQVSSH